jgi:hypothetical protein
MPNRREPPPPPPPSPPAVDSTALMERPDFGDDDDGGVGPGGFDDDDFTSKVGLERTQPPRDGERTGRFPMTEVGDSLPLAHVSELQELDEFGGLDDLDDFDDDLDGRAATAIMRITPDMLREAQGESAEDSEFAPPTSSELDGEIELQRWSAGSGASPARPSPPSPLPVAMDGNLEITDPTRRASGQAVTQIAVPLPPVPVLRAEQIPNAPPPGATVALVDEADAALAAAHNAVDATAARFYIQRARQVLARLRDQLD